MIRSQYTRFEFEFHKRTWLIMANDGTEYFFYAERGEKILQNNFKNEIFRFGCS